MPGLLVLIFVGVPLLELFVILQVGAAFGGWLTAGLLIADSILGAVLLRFEGRRAWAEFRQALGEGRWPGDEVAQGALIIVGGTLLVTPGFVTDVAGFLLLLSPSRRLVARAVRARMERSMVGGPPPPGTGGDPRRARGHRPATGSPRARGGASRTDRADLEVEVVEIRREQPPVDGRPQVDGDDRPDDASDRGDGSPREGT